VDLTKIAAACESLGAIVFFVTRHPSESENRSTAELDPTSLQGLLDTEGRDRPTALMNRDELLGLVNATAATPSSSNVVPRALLEQRDKIASSETTPVEDIEVGRGISPLIVMAIIGVLIGMFVAIVATAN